MNTAYSEQLHLPHTRHVVRITLCAMFLDDELVLRLGYHLDRRVMVYIGLGISGSFHVAIGARGRAERRLEKTEGGSTWGSDRLSTQLNGMPYTRLRETCSLLFAPEARLARPGFLGHLD